VWEVLVRDAFAVSGRRSLVAVTMLAALGLGALNEVVEFVATLAQGESHVGGYTNTGWDLVTNTFAGLLAAVVIHRRRRDVDGQDDVTTGRDPAAGRAGVDVTLVG
jgi:hypothetical protein